MRYQVLLFAQGDYAVMSDKGTVMLVTRIGSDADAECDRLNRVEIERAERALLAASGVLPAWAADDTD